MLVIALVNSDYIGAVSGTNRRLTIQAGHNVVGVFHAQILCT